MSLITSSIGQGLLWGILALGLYLTFRILNFPDMTVEGTFPFGAAICVSALVPVSYTHLTLPTILLV